VSVPNPIRITEAVSSKIVDGDQILLAMFLVAKNPDSPDKYDLVMRGIKPAIEHIRQSTEDPVARREFLAAVDALCAEFKSMVHP
jgi:hypothetical protein